MGIAVASSRPQVLESTRINVESNQEVQCFERFGGALADAADGYSDTNNKR